MENPRQEKEDKCSRDGFPYRRTLEFRPNAEDDRSCKHDTKADAYDR